MPHYFVQCLTSRNTYRRYYSESLPDICAIITLGYVGVAVADTHQGYIEVDSYYLPLS